MYDVLYRPLCSLNHSSIVRDEIILQGIDNKELAFYDGVYDPFWFTSILNMELNILYLMLHSDMLEPLSCIIRRQCNVVPWLYQWLDHRFELIDTNDMDRHGYSYFRYSGHV